MSASDSTISGMSFLAAVVADSRRPIGPVRGAATPAGDPIGATFDAPTSAADAIGDSATAADDQVPAIPAAVPRHDRPQSSPIPAKTLASDFVPPSPDFDASYRRKEMGDFTTVTSRGESAGDDAGRDVLSPESQSEPDAGDGERHRSGPAAARRSPRPQAAEGSHATSRRRYDGPAVATRPDRATLARATAPIPGNVFATGSGPDRPARELAIDARPPEPARPSSPQPGRRPALSLSPVARPVARTPERGEPSPAAMQRPPQTDRAGTPTPDDRPPLRPVRGLPADVTKPADSPVSSPTVHIGQLEIHIDAPQPSARERARAPARLNGSGVASRLYMRKT